MATEIETNPLIEKLQAEKRVAADFQSRKHDHWKENYLLYRDFVEKNRLTQRQAVNVPIMKETIKTLLSRIDDPPMIRFESLDNDKIKEFVLQELWDYYAEKLNYEGLDMQDKKNVLLFGRSFKKLNFLNDDFDCEVLDVYDVLVDPKTNPLNLETANWIIHQHIFKPLREILANPKYDEEGKRKLKEYLESEEGILKIQDIKESWEAKKERLEKLGVDNFEEFAAKDVLIELNEHFTYLWDEKKKKFVKYLIILAADNAVLFKKPLKEVIGVEFYPFVTWAEDVDISDFWSDGVGDMIRTPNKVLNIWLSQLLENRTLRNFGMYWFNSSIGEFFPQTFEPKPFGMYPVPGNPAEMIVPITIPPLTETINEMQYLTSLIERATAATAIEKGVSERKQITLGEVELLAGKAAERITAIAKFYRKAWKEFAQKWYEILSANVSENKTIKLYKTSYKGNIFEKEVKAKDWKSKAGYRIKVLSSSEQEAEKTSSIQRLLIIKNHYPDNRALQRILQKRILEIANLTPDELKEIETEEKEKERALLPTPTPTPIPPEAEIPPEKLLSLRETISKALEV